MHYDSMYIKTVRNLGHSYSWNMGQGGLEGGIKGGFWGPRSVLVLALNSGDMGLYSS